MSNNFDIPLNSLTLQLLSRWGGRKHCLIIGGGAFSPLILYSEGLPKRGDTTFSFIKLLVDTIQSAFVSHFNVDKHFNIVLRGLIGDLRNVNFLLYHTTPICF